MKTRNLFKAAMVAVAMVAMTSAFSSCSKDNDDTVKPVTKNNTIEQNSGSSTNQKSDENEVLVPGQSRVYFTYNFGVDFFKVYDVKLIYTGEDGSQVTENVNESNTTATTNNTKLPDGSTKWGCKAYLLSKKIYIHTYPFEASFRVEVTPKVNAPAVTGEVGASVYYQLSTLSTTNKGIASKYLHKFNYFSLEGVEAGKAQSVLDDVLKKETKAFDSFTVTFDKNGKITTNHPELEVD